MVILYNFHFAVGGNLAKYKESGIIGKNCEFYNN